MPRLADLRRQYSTATDFSDRDVQSDESLVSDFRSQLSPTDVVERKFGEAVGVCYWLLGGLRSPRSQTTRRVLPR